MRVIVCNDVDAQALMLRLQVKHNELLKRFAQQDNQQAHIVDETMRAVNYELVNWLQAQGFTLR